MDTKRFQADWMVGDLATLEENISNLPTQRIQPYYRSKAFISKIGINPLISAASPIFFLTEQIELSETPFDLDQFHEHMVHEVKAFENQVQTQGYHSHIVLAARYVICLWVDETILNTKWGRQSLWQNHLLINLSETGENKSFFLLLSHCLQDPSSYLHLLELLYLCLSLGFEGEYRYIERGHIQLAKVYDNLFHCIQQQRGEVSKQLEISMVENATPNKYLKRLLLRSTSLFIAVLLPITTYFVINHYLENNAKQINKKITAMVAD